jgi:chromosome segregation ATPase
LTGAPIFSHWGAPSERAMENQGERVTPLNGMEKFNHLEDKLYRIVEQIKTLRQEKEMLEREVSSLRRDVGARTEENEQLNQRIQQMMSERDTIKNKVEAMLDAIALIEPEIAEAAKKG